MTAAQINVREPFLARTSQNRRCFNPLRQCSYYGGRVVRPSTATFAGGVGKGRRIQLSIGREARRHCASDDHFAQCQREAILPSPEASALRGAIGVGFNICLRHFSWLTVGLCLAVFYERRVVSVEDQVVFVSEASHGIGKAIARAFAERSAQVVITGRDLHSLERAEEEIGKRGSEDFAGSGGGKGAARAVFSILYDVTVKANVEALVESVVSRFGRMETLVNVAGVNQRKPAEAITEEDYDWVLEVGLKGGFRLSQKAGHLMIARGCQINVVSLNTYRPLENVLPYTMSKSALGQMTNALALECGNGDGGTRFWDGLASRAIWLGRRLFWLVRPLRL